MTDAHRFRFCVCRSSFSSARWSHLSVNLLNECRASETPYSRKTVLCLLRTSRAVFVLNRHDYVRVCTGESCTGCRHVARDTDRCSTATLRGHVIPGATTALVHFEFSSDSTLAGATRFAGDSIPEKLTETSATFPALRSPPNYPRVSWHRQYSSTIEFAGGPPAGTISGGTLNDLKPGTTYYDRVVTVVHSPFFPHQQYYYGTPAMFVTAGTPDSGSPNGVLLGATDISSTTALLHGRIHPASGATVAAFEYHYYGEYQPDPSPLLFTGEESVGSGAAWSTIEVPVSDLPPGTVVHFRIVARNPRGELRTPWKSFTTPAGLPTAKPKPATFIRPTSAVLNSELTTGNLEGSFFFEYGTSADLSDAASTPEPCGSREQRRLRLPVGLTCSGGVGRKTQMTHQVVSRIGVFANGRAWPRAVMRPIIKPSPCGVPAVPSRIGRMMLYRRLATGA